MAPRQQATATRLGPTYADSDQLEGPPSSFNRSIGTSTRRKRPLVKGDLLVEICAELGIYPSDVLAGKRGSDYTTAKRLYTGICIDILRERKRSIMLDLDANSVHTIRGWYNVYSDLFANEKVVHRRGTNGWSMRQLRWMVLERFDVSTKYKTEKELG